jgi:uncharacterized membrane protein YqiK
MFDPSELTVKQARARLCELDIAGLEELLQAEIDGRHRSSLIADIGRAIDMIKTAEEAEEAEEVEEAEEAEEVEEVEEAPKAAKERVSPPAPIIPESEWFKYPRHVRKDWFRLADGTFQKR